MSEVSPGAWSWAAVGISILAFTSGHAVHEWPAALAYGLLMAGLWINRKDLIACITAHAVTNIALACFVYATGFLAVLVKQARAVLVTRMGGVERRSTIRPWQPLERGRPAIRTALTGVKARMEVPTAAQDQVERTSLSWRWSARCAADRARHLFPGLVPIAGFAYRSTAIPCRRRPNAKHGVSGSNVRSMP